MNNSNIHKAHASEGHRKVGELKKKIAATSENIEMSKEIIASTPSDAQREKLIEKNTQRKHAIGSMKKEIEDIEQTIRMRDREANT